MPRWFWDAQLQLLNEGINLKDLIHYFVCFWDKSWIGSGTLRGSMQGVRKMEKSVVGVRNCVNHLVRVNLLSNMLKSSRESIMEVTVLPQDWLQVWSAHLCRELSCHNRWRSTPQSYITLHRIEDACGWFKVSSFQWLDKGEYVGVCESTVMSWLWQ